MVNLAINGKYMDSFLYYIASSKIGQILNLKYPVFNLF